MKGGIALFVLVKRERNTSVNECIKDILVFDANCFLADISLVRLAGEVGGSEAEKRKRFDLFYYAFKSDH